MYHQFSITLYILFSTVIHRWKIGSFPTLVQLVYGRSHYEGIAALHFSDLQVNVQMVGSKNQSTDFQYY